MTKSEFEKVLQEGYNKANQQEKEAIFSNQGDTNGK
jgi:hypothetical protein